MREALGPQLQVPSKRTLVETSDLRLVGFEHLVTLLVNVRESLSEAHVYFNVRAWNGAALVDDQRIPQQ